VIKLSSNFFISTSDVFAKNFVRFFTRFSFDLDICYQQEVKISFRQFFEYFSTKELEKVRNSSILQSFSRASYHPFPFPSRITMVNIQEHSPSSLSIPNGFVTPPSRSSTPPENQPSPASSHASLDQSAVSAEGTVKSSRASSRLQGTVKWFNAKNGYGFITRSDNGEDVFVHFTGIARKNPRHTMKSLGDGELVEFNVLATNVTGPENRPVRGNIHASSLIPIRRNDSYAAGDPVIYPPRYIRGPVNYGNSRIPRWVPNWQPRQF
jgi:cold shock CspA family protein